MTLAIAAFTAATPFWFTTRVQASKHMAANVTTMQSVSVEHVRFPSTALCTEASACALAPPHDTVLFDSPHAWTHRASAGTAKTHLISIFYHLAALGDVVPRPAPRRPVDRASGLKGGSESSACSEAPAGRLVIRVPGQSVLPPRRRSLGDVFNGSIASLAPVAVAPA